MYGKHEHSRSGVQIFISICHLIVLKMFHNNSFAHVFYNTVIYNRHIYGANKKLWNHLQMLETGNNRDKFTRGAIEIPLFFVIIVE